MSEFSMNARSFQQAVGQEQLIGSKCLDCGGISLPQKQICGNCFSNKTELVQFSGKGSLAAFTVIYVPPTSMAEAGYNAKNPYGVGIVKLEEGPSVSAQLIGFDWSDPSKIKIGTVLQRTSVERGPEGATQKYLAFEPREAANA